MTPSFSKSLHEKAHCTESYKENSCICGGSASQHTVQGIRLPLGIAQLLHGQLLLQADLLLLLLLLCQVAEVSSQTSLQRVNAGLSGLMPAPGALQSLATQVLPAQAHNRPDSVRMRSILHRHIDIPWALQGKL